MANKTKNKQRENEGFKTNEGSGDVASKDETNRGHETEDDTGTFDREESSLYESHAYEERTGTGSEGKSGTAHAGEREGKENETRSGGLGDALKKLVSAGIGAAFMTEESIRTYLNEVRLPKEVLNMIVQGAGKSKEELLNRVGNEVVKIISKIDFVNEASRFVEEHKFRVSAEVEVIKKDKSGEKSGEK
jgi:hypothetical protein